MKTIAGLLILLTVLSMLFLMALSFNTASATNPETDETPASHTSPSSSAPVRVAYLTFDDGPSRNVTTGILDLLYEEGIQATFFVLPMDGLDDVYLRIINEGHELANHSYSHNYNRLYTKSVESFIEDVKKLHSFILYRFDYTMTSFRFPGGPFGFPTSVFDERRAALRGIGYREFAWHVDPSDYTPKVIAMSGEELASRVLSEVSGLGNKNHVILLFHDRDVNRSTLKALPFVIAGLRQRGFTFDTVGNFPLTRADIRAYEEHQRATVTTRTAGIRLGLFRSKLFEESVENLNHRTGQLLFE